MAAGFEYPPYLPTIGTFQPDLRGATGNPVVTYNTRNGLYITFGGFCFFFLIIATGTMAKATTSTDAVRIGLPIAMRADAGMTVPLTAQAINSSGLKGANYASVSPGNDYAILQQASITANLVDFTYSMLQTLGNYVGTSNFILSGFYPV